MEPIDIPPYLPGLLDEADAFDLQALCEACSAASDEMLALVHEGVLEPLGSSAADWRFGAAALPRARRAMRLQHELELDPVGVAVVLDLLDRIEFLQARLRRLGAL